MSDTTQKELPVFEFDGGRKMFPPYVLNSSQEYEQKISRGDPETLGEDIRFITMQAYFAGFSRACAFVDMLHSDPNPEVTGQRAAVLEAVKHELSEFSRLNREFGQVLGVGHVSVKNG